MPLTIRIANPAAKFLRRLGGKQKRQIAAKIDALAVNPRPQDRKPLAGFPDDWRVDQGEYRITYCFDLKTLVIAVVGLRNDDDVYKVHKRYRGH